MVAEATLAGFTKRSWAISEQISVLDGNSQCLYIPVRGLLARMLVVCL